MFICPAILKLVSFCIMLFQVNPCLVFTMVSKPAYGMSNVAWPGICRIFSWLWQFCIWTCSFDLSQHWVGHFGSHSTPSEWLVITPQSFSSVMVSIKSFPVNVSCWMLLKPMWRNFQFSILNNISQCRFQISITLHISCWSVSITDWSYLPRYSYHLWISALC